MLPTVDVEVLELESNATTHDPSPQTPFMPLKMQAVPSGRLPLKKQEPEKQMPVFTQTPAKQGVPIGSPLQFKASEVDVDMLLELAVELLVTPVVVDGADIDVEIPGVKDVGLVGTEDGMVVVALVEL